MSLYRYYIKPFLRHPVNKNNRIKAIFNFIKWQLLLRHANNSGSYIIAPYIGGLKCMVKKGLSGITGNLYSGLHEFEEMGFLLHFLREDDIFFDIGANVGIYTLLASGIKHANSYSFEPIPETYFFLKSNIAINNLESKALSMNVGVAGEDGFLNFSAEYGAMNHVVGPDYTGKVAKVKVIVLDQEFAHRISSCTMLKIDTEGYEDQILSGAEKILENTYVKAILIEMNKPEVIHAIINKHGFKPYSYDVFKRTLVPVDYKSSDNVIYIRDEVFVQNRVTSSEKIQVKGVLI